MEETWGGIRPEIEWTVKACRPRPDTRSTPLTPPDAVLPALGSPGFLGPLFTQRMLQCLNRDGRKDAGQQVETSVCQRLVGTENRQRSSLRKARDRSPRDKRAEIKHRSRWRSSVSWLALSIGSEGSMGRARQASHICISQTVTSSE